MCVLTLNVKYASSLKYFIAYLAAGKMLNIDKYPIQSETRKEVEKQNFVLEDMNSRDYRRDDRR